MCLEQVGQPALWPCWLWECSRFLVPAEMGSFFIKPKFASLCLGQETQTLTMENELGSSSGRWPPGDRGRTWRGRGRTDWGPCPLPHPQA